MKLYYTTISTGYTKLYKDIVSKNELIGGWVAQSQRGLSSLSCCSSILCCCRWWYRSQQSTLRAAARRRGAERGVIRCRCQALECPTPRRCRSPVVHPTSSGSSAWGGCSTVSSLSAITHNPPCGQLLPGLEAGGVSYVVAAVIIILALPLRAVG